MLVPVLSLSTSTCPPRRRTISATTRQAEAGAAVPRAHKRLDRAFAYVLGHAPRLCLRTDEEAQFGQPLLREGARWSLDCLREAIELRTIEDACEMTIGKGHDTAALQLGGRAADGLERQTQVARDVGPAPWQVDVASIVTVAHGAFELLDEHRHPSDGVSPANHDGLALRLAKFVRHLAQKLKLEFGVASQQCDQRVRLNPIQR